MHVNMLTIISWGGFYPRKFWWTNFIRNSHQNFLDRFEKQKISGAKFVLPKILGAFGAFSFISYVIPYGPWEKKTIKFFRRMVKRLAWWPKNAGNLRITGP